MTISVAWNGETDAAIADMVAKMKAAGLDDIIAEAQRQLDEFLANK